MVGGAAGRVHAGGRGCPRYAQVPRAELRMESATICNPFTARQAGAEFRTSLFPPVFPSAFGLARPAKSKSRGVKKQGFTGVSLSLGLAQLSRGTSLKSLHRKDLRPDRQHPDEQSKRRQRGGFPNHGPNHDPSSLTGQNGNIVLLLFQRVKPG